MITTTGITKSFGELKVLKGIDIEIEEKEVVSIVGASGAGKTTLLQIIGTLDKPDSGTITYNGTDTARLKGKALSAFRNTHIGFVFQFHQLLPEFTALENVCIPAYIAGKSKTEAEARAAELLGFLNLSERLDHKPSELSGGEQQRVAVARALINNPAVILADEPSGNLDSENKNELHKLFFRLRDSFGQTIVIVTHDRQLAGMSDRILQIKDGLIIYES
jgi:lipoprotein-releasing system ATP-binding protein